MQKHPDLIQQRADHWHALRWWGRELALLWEQPLWSAVFAMIVYTAIGARYTPLLHASLYPYFNHLADSLLHGQLSLRTLPATTHDMSLFNGEYYLYWPPLPAILLMPFVAIFGVGFSDILWTIALAGFNVALVAVLLRQATQRDLIALDAVGRGLLVLTFALGTVHITLAPYGRVWYTGQIVGFACVLLAYLATITRHGYAAFGLTGLALGCALLTRNHLVLAGVWPAYYLLTHHWEQRWSRLIRYAVVGLAPIVCAVALLGVYNYLRFGSPLDNGLDYHRMSEFFRADYERYGAFHPYYLPTNLFYQFIAYPFPLRPTTAQGGSLFLLTPVFAAIFWSFTDRMRRWSALWLSLTVLIVAIPILLLIGTGWRQFGPRYTLDFTVPLLLLTALGLRRWPKWIVAVLALISVIHYVIGSLWLVDVI